MTAQDTARTEFEAWAEKEYGLLRKDAELEYSFTDVRAAWRAWQAARSAHPPAEPAADMREALRDMLAGWKYIRSTHGDLYGVGWDRAQDKAEKALALPQPPSDQAGATYPNDLVWEVGNKVFGALFASKQAAEQFASGHSPAVGLNVSAREVFGAPAQAAQVAGEAPEGWQLVPKVPTVNMLAAMEEQWCVGSNMDVALREYKAMLAAAPKPTPPTEGGA